MKYNKNLYLCFVEFLSWQQPIKYHYSVKKEELL